MLSRRTLVPYVVFGILPFVSSTGFSQSDNTDVRPELKSIQILAADALTKNVKSEVQIGSHEFPLFNVDVKEGSISSLGVVVNVETTVSLIRRDADKSAFMLYLFFADEDGKVVALFDINMDGIWDVRKTPTREHMNFIRVKDKWVEVDRIEGLQGKEPSAFSAGVRYTFDRSSWIGVRD